MLTGAVDAADDLVRAALRRQERVSRPAAGRAGHLPPSASEQLLADLVREYLRRSTRRRVDQPEPVGESGEPGEVLHALRPRQRAAALLLLVEGWSAEDAAQVVGVPPSRLPSLVPRTEGLADALHALADQHPPRPEHSGGPGPDHGRRPRHRSVIPVLAGVGAVVAVAVLVGQTPRPGLQDPAVVGPDSTSPSVDLADRGWILDAEEQPPAFLEGLRLLEVSTIDYADATAPLVIDTRPRAGHAVFAALWCDIPALDANLVPPTATLTLAGHTVSLPCAGKGGEPALRRLVPLPPPPPERPGRTRSSIVWKGDLPGRGDAVLATFTEFGQNEPPRPPVLAPEAPPAAPQGAAVLDGDSVSADVDGGEVFVQRVAVSSQTHVSVWTGQTGTFTILVDGVVVSDDGDTAPALAGGRSSSEQRWRAQDPELRNGTWTVHAPGQTKTFPLPERVRPRPGETREVTLQVRVHSGAEGRWQVRATSASPVAVGSPPVPESRADTSADVRDRRHGGQDGRVAR